MTFKNKKIQKLISSLMVIAMLSPSLFVFFAPKRAEAQFTDPVNSIWQAIQTAFGFVEKTAVVTDTGISVKNVAKEIAKQLLMVVAKRALAQMTKSTVNWINSGFHGAPLFLENPQSFFNDIAKSEIKNLINIIGYDPIRFPFGQKLALDTIA